jgi:competence protein ComEA
MAPPPAPRRRPAWLRRADQAVLAAGAAIALVGIGGYWLAAGGARGRLIDIERAPPRVVEYKVDLNRAQWPELSELPEIGETLARRIVASRLAEGPFRSVDDLRRVRGIGPRTLEQLRPFLLPLPERGVVVEQPLPGRLPGS